MLAALDGLEVLIILRITLPNLQRSPFVGRKSIVCIKLPIMLVSHR